MTVDLLDHVLILGASWRVIVATALLSVGTTVAVSLSSPHVVVAEAVAALDRAAIAREERDVAELKSIMNGLHPSQNEYWTARHHLRQAETTLRALRQPVDAPKPKPGPSFTAKVFASLLGGAFAGALIIWGLAYWRAATNERPLKARAFDLREKGFIR